MWTALMMDSRGQVEAQVSSRNVEKECSGTTTPVGVPTGVQPRAAIQGLPYMMARFT
ncbi:MAG: hypothetical protein HC933_09920 [Pleurocapsa sp. SU_196_0]|nr:hypothetical protein [Pleurocapsa sp. SU_196_0]